MNDTANCLADTVELPGARQFVDSPKRNSVAESMVSLKNKSCKSTVEPSRGIAEIR